jgi:hydroxypyruvate reductase
MPMTEAGAREALGAMFQAAIASAAAGPAVVRNLPEKPQGRCVVIGAGKASAAMAAALDAAWPDVPLSGVVVTRYGHAVPAGRIIILESSHPKPDENSVLAARQILQAVQGLGPEDLVIALISGGGSALMCLPAGAMTLEDKRAVNDALLKSGANITEMNTVRKHLSAIKGGRLAAAAQPARVVTMVISDVPGDDPAVIASGPTMGDATTWADAKEIIARYRLALPAAAQALVEEGQETPKPGAFPVDLKMIATPAMALQAAAAKARSLGITPLILGDALEGEAAVMGTVLAGIARSVKEHGQPVAAPAVLLSGGEGTVTIGSAKAGRGGRNTAFLLGFAVAAAGAEGVYAIAGDSDGIDGTEDAAGAMVTPTTLARGAALGLNARALLAGHDSYSYFSALGDLVVTGPTLTNVNDIRAVLVTG